MFCKSSLAAPDSQLAFKKTGRFLREEEVREFVSDSKVVLAKKKKTRLYPHACKCVRTNFSSSGCRIFCEMNDVRGITVLKMSSTYL